MKLVKTRKRFKKFMNILEAYAKKLAVSEQVYANEHGDRKLSESKKLAIARVLANTSEYLNEALN